MKYYISIFLFLSSSLYSESFLDKQIRLRTEKPLSILTGYNNLSNYYSTPFVGISYLLDSRNEIGTSFIFTKYTSPNLNNYIPVSNTLIVTNETYSLSQNSVKFFYNYYILNSPINLNITLGSLPAVSNSYSAQIISSQYSNSYFQTDINVTRKSTGYFSPGLGTKIIIENGIFLSIVGGPTFIFENQVKSNTLTFLESNSEYQNAYANLAFDSIINSRKKELSGFSKNRVEAYIDFSVGFSF